MMKRIFILIPILLILLTNCGDSFDYDVAGKSYLVTSPTLNIRESARPNSKKVGSLKEGDVIVAKYQVREWIALDYSNKISYVSSKYLKAFEIIEMEETFDPVLNPTSATIKTYIDDYGDWASWKFWVTLIVLSFVSLILINIGLVLPPIIRVKEDGFREYGHYFPYFTAFLGFLFAIAFVFWEESVLRSIFIDPFWWLTTGKGGVAWYLWIISSLWGIGAFIWFIIFVLYFKFTGLFLWIFFLITGIVTFINLAYLSIAGIVIFVGIAVAVIGIYILIGLGQGSSQTGNYKSDENLGSKPREKKVDEQMKFQQWEKKWWDDYNKNNPK